MTESKYSLDTKENIEYLRLMREELLKFGVRFPSPKGGSWYLGDNGEPVKEKPRETWITSRMCHVYSIGSIIGDKEYAPLARTAEEGLLSGELADKQSGGWYAGVAANGDILPTKQCYAHAFVILAATSAMNAGLENAGQLLEKGLEIYDRYFWDEDEGLARDTWDTGFSECDSYRGLNANMHSVEAFLAVADTVGDRKYRERAGRVIDRVIKWARDNFWRIPEHYTSDWVPQPEVNKDNPADQFKPYGATPGHGIEWSRLIVQYAVSSNLPEKETVGYIDAAQKLYTRAVEDAWNSDGAKGICYTTDWNGKPCVHDRMHWTLAEAINTSATLYRVTGKDKYKQDYAEFMEYLDEKVYDHVNGSWFHQLDRNNNVVSTVWPGKCDLYHAFQATMIPYIPVGISISKAAQNFKN